MKFLADEDIYAVTVQWLRQASHDVLWVVESEHRGAPDEDILAWAIRESRILVTRDKGFGQRFVAAEGRGLILLRGDFNEMPAVHAVLQSALAATHHAVLSAGLVVVTPTRYRIRSLP